MTLASTASRHAGADHGVDVEATPARTYDEVRDQFYCRKYLRTACICRSMRSLRCLGLSNRKNSTVLRVYSNCGALQNFAWMIVLYDMKQNSTWKNG
jgi:hypothetical protein